MDEEKTLGSSDALAKPTRVQRAIAYVDGFNLYYGALKDGPHRWLDVAELSRRLLQPSQKIVAVRYFSARVQPRPGNPQQTQRQQVAKALWQPPSSLSPWKMPTAGSIDPRAGSSPLKSKSRRGAALHPAAEANRGGRQNPEFPILVSGYATRSI
jgi:hypothetical protein